MKQRTILVSIVVILTATLAQAVPYKSENIRGLVQKDEKGVMFFDMKELDQRIESLAIHAASYPPKFDSEADKNRAHQDIIFLSDMLEPLVNAKDPNPEILWRTGLISGMGYNMDMPGMSRTADAVFKKALELKPEHMLANYHYGIFLASRAEFKKAQYYFKEAQTLGHPDAEFSLGLTYLGLGEKTKALATLNSYQKKNPNKNISRMINSIENAPIEIKK